MDWQQRLANLVAPILRLEPAQWLTIATATAFLLLLAVLIVQTRQHARVRRELAGLIGNPPQPSSDGLDPSTALEGISLSPIDRVFPRRPAGFLALVAIIALGCWIAGYLLAPNVAHFFASPEWQFQPFYIAAHLVTLRLFINVFTRNYAAGTSHLAVSRAQALRGIRPILGPFGALAAVLIAVPFCVFDYQYLFSPRYARMGQDEVVRAIDYLMWGIWSLEWFINAFIWVLLVGFMIKNCLTILKYPFRSPIHVVLHDKQYRPFLQMSAQGSTAVLGFSCVSVAYIYYTGGELTDYLGLGITVSLLVVGFVPPWLLLRAKVDKAVRAETISLRRGAGLGPPGLAAVHTIAANAAGMSLEKRVDEALALLRIWHLQNLYGNLGQTEATAIFVRLLAPAATIGWQVAHNYGTMAKKLTQMLGGTGEP